MTRLHSSARFHLLFPTIGGAVVAVLALFLLSGALGRPIAAQTKGSSSSAGAAAQLMAWYGSPGGVIFRAPENCVDEAGNPYYDPATLAYCAVKDVVGALGGPSAGGSVTDFVVAPYRYEYNQPLDCDAVRPPYDSRHADCAVLTGAATLLRTGLPVRLFGICELPRPSDCAELGTITDLTWKPDGVYMLMDPTRVTIVCSYAQDADRNGCNENGAYTAGKERPYCADDPNDRRCEYRADQLEAMLAAYTGYCTRDALNCRENQLEARWGVDALVAVGYLNRGDQAWDCADSRTKAEHFLAAVNTRWGTNKPLVQLYLDVPAGVVRFADAATGCQVPRAP